MSSNGNNRNEIEDITVKELNTIISEFLADERMELLKINRFFSKINKMLMSQHHETLEWMNTRLQKQVTTFQEIYVDCYCYICKLLQENLKQFKAVETFNNAQEIMQGAYEREV